MVAQPIDRDAARVVNERFKLHGFSLTSDAIRLILSRIGASGTPNRDDVDRVLKIIGQVEHTSSTLSAEVIERAFAERGADDSVVGVGVDVDDDEARATGTDRASGSDGLTVCDAHATRRYAYDAQRRTFDETRRAARAAGQAESKIDLYRDRFLLLQQRLARSRQLARSSLKGTRREEGAELSTINSLLGVSKEKKYIMGLLSQLEDGVFYMEDLSGTIRVDLTVCERSIGLFTENCVVLAAGEVRPDGVFEVLELTFPPSEKRAATREATSAIDFFGAGHVIRPYEVEDLERKEQERVGEAFVVLSDVWLDQPRTFDRLAKMFELFDAQDDVPGLMVFMGDFSSQPFGPTHCDFQAYIEGFERLAEMLQDFPRLRQESRFVFVPGPGDPGLSAALPRPAMQKSLVGSFVEKVPRAQFASNPAKIRYFSQDLVFFRDDLQAKMRRNCLIPPDDDKLTDKQEWPVFQHLVATLVQQAHLCPLPLTQSPIYWEFDHSLWLYPAPNFIFLGDRSETQCAAMNDETSLMNPGCFADDGSFLFYRPATRTYDFSAVP